MLSGEVEHGDSLGNEGVIRTGDDPMVDVALDPTVPAGAILTPEEIEAFRGE